MSVRISGIVHTKNEERDIARALGSLASWCDELIVVDMNSTDDTVRIARSFGAKVVTAPDYGYADRAYALGVAAASGEWIVRLDADELIPPLLSVELRRISTADVADAVEIPRLNYMFGRPVRHAGWGPDSDRLWRFFKREIDEIAVGPSEVHAARAPDSGRRTLRLPLSEGLCIVHFNYTDWSQFVVKMNRYTSIEAQELARSGRKLSLVMPVRSVVVEFLRRGIRRRGWRDGYRGVALVWMQMTYKILVYVKARQLLDVGDEQAILAEYDDIAARQLEADR